MKMQPIRKGIATIVAATVIGAGLLVPTAGAAPAVNTNSTVKVFAFNQESLNDVLKQITEKYGMDLSKIDCNKITAQLPSTGSTEPVTKPSTGSNTPDNTTKPGTGAANGGSSSNGGSTSGSTGSGSTEAGNSSLSQFQSEVIALVNKERAKAGLSALSSDALLTKVATEKARDMDVNNYFSHTSPTYGSPFDMMRSFGVKYSYAGENIASGQRTPQEVMTAWMNSAGHRANILNGNFTKIGVGYVNGEWVQMFIG
ncbi:Cysteine-rich secretory protein family protein [compost metagenome]